MSDRRPEKLWARDEAHRACEHEREASPADLVAAVRRGVESGTIEGVEHKGWLVIPVDGGES